VLPVLFFFARISLPVRVRFLCLLCSGTRRGEEQGRIKKETEKHGLSEGFGEGDRRSGSEGCVGEVDEGDETYEHG